MHHHAIIPFNKPTVAGDEFLYMQQACSNGHISGDGIFTKKCHALLEEMLGVRKVLLTTSCTHALEMTALLLDISAGDEVIVPSFTFVSTVNAFVMRGAIPKFVDIRPDTLNMDENLLERGVSSKTKVIVTMHYAGVGCEMDSISKVAFQHGATVIEDNAHGLFGKYRGQNLGTFGGLATQSFHETKNFICGEGGALFLNDPQYIARVEILREKGTNRSLFFRGEVDKYSWVDVGSSYLPSDLLAAFLLAQLEQREKIQRRRRDIWELYHSGLQGWADLNRVAQPFVPNHCEQPHHMYYLILPSLADRQALIEHLSQAGIMSVFHYLPLHLSEMGKRYGGKKGDCPVAEDISDRLLRLPFYNSLEASDQEFIIDRIKRFRTGVGS